MKGDALNALLRGAGHNMRNILRKLRFFYALFEFKLRQLLVLLMPAAVPVPIAEIPRISPACPQGWADSVWKSFCSLAVPSFKEKFFPLK